MREPQPLTPDKIKQINNLLYNIENEYSVNEQLSSVEFIEYLQSTHYEISSLIYNVYDYVRGINICDSEFDLLKIQCRKLKEKQNELVTKLQSMKSNINEELESFYKNVQYALKEKNEQIIIPNIKQLDELKDFINQPTLLTEIATSNSNKELSHPKHNPNLWNQSCFDLFKYLFDNYYKGDKRQLTNIWYYLKEYQPQQYTLKATKKVYKEFISLNYRIKLTNTDKAIIKYNDKEYPTMNEHRQNFEGSFK